ncbi:MAG: TVP38/TMEM64 family protein [Verrucomicrobia bacterium]|nr:MAG: TVP38/TMEM64 family protein [Verrucomicrobiota bacterium]PYI46582.1 MAG: TVP38/TMEM64 family protein [Verrucomicrobiota bacterium]
MKHTATERRSYMTITIHEMPANEKKAPKSAVLQLIALIAILIALFLAMKFLPVQQWTRNFNDWVGQMGVAGVFIFIGVYAVATVLLAPGSILTIGAGLAFGLWKGFLAVSAGSTLGAVLAFLVARFVARDKVEAIARQNEKFGRIDNAIGKEGAKLIFLLRLSPVIPFNVSNYFYGLTAVKFWPYVLASWIGMMPGAFLYVYIGATGKAAVSVATGSEAAQHGWQYWTFMSVGLAATIIVTIWVTRIARDALEKTGPM